MTDELKVLNAWHNYAKEETEWRDTPPETDEKALELIPQIPAAQGMYSVYRNMGKSILEAMQLTLESCIGDVAK